uniref:Uncharacterized protein n=2 Tax=Panagrolaimus sp. JU765 TaxID=591449 RepID=A0AC34QXD6_9BILA
MARFENKVVIVTGSSTGIGQSAALLFGKEGAKVTIHGRSDAGLEKTKNLLKEAGVSDDRILVVKGEIQEDKTLENLVNETVKKFGKLDIVVANAGIGFYDKGKGPHDPATLSYLLDVNLVSGVKLLQLAAPHLEKTKGNVVYVSSIVALMQYADNPFYAVSKAALDHWTRHAAIIYGTKGIRVNSVNPGGVRTDFVRRMGYGDEFLQKLEDVFISGVNPLGRISLPDEQAEAIAFLASDQAGYCNGSIFVVDGGQHLVPPKIDMKL